MTTATTLTVKEALGRSADWLAERGVESARLDAELLLGQVLGLARLDLYLQWDRPLSESEKGEYRDLLKRRGEGEPVAYILGRREFFSLDFEVTPFVLVPRPETELLVERALELIESVETQSPRIADVGTGSGCIAVALATHAPHAEIVATDVSQAALEVARRNAERHDAADRITWHCGPLLDDIPGPFDLVVSNPPYVADGDRASLPRDVTDYEPAQALFAGPDGLDVIRGLAPQAAECLAPGGWLAIEIGLGQAPAVCEILQSTGAFEAPDVRPDYARIDRVVSARRRP